MKNEEKEEHPLFNKRVGIWMISAIVIAFLLTRLPQVSVEKGMTLYLIMAFPFMIVFILWDKYSKH